MTPAECWDAVLECMAADWTVLLGTNPAHADERCCVTLQNWRTGGFWTGFTPTWEQALGAALERVRREGVTDGEG